MLALVRACMGSLVRVRAQRASRRNEEVDLTIVKTGRIDRSHRTRIPYRGRQYDCAVALTTSYLEHLLSRLDVPSLRQLSALLYLGANYVEVVRLVRIEGGDAIEVV